MTIEEASKLASALKRGKLGLTALSYAVVFVLTLISGGTAAYVVTKAQGIATKDDLAETTGIIKDVEIKIADASWQSQRFWEEKKLLYIELVKVLDELNVTYTLCEQKVGTLTMAEKTPPHLQEIFDRAKTKSFEFRQIVAVSAIFLSPKAQQAAESFSRDSRRFSETEPKATKAADWCREYRAAARKARTQVIEAARADLSAGLRSPKLPSSQQN
jgi:hypothetical protein